MAARGASITLPPAGVLTDSLSLWRSFPHLMLVPALTIAVIQIAFIFLGDGLNDALNPRHRRR